jgi:hypothetical protein
MSSLGFTGTSKGLTQKQAKALLRLLTKAGGVLWMHNGDCIGADAEAAAMWGRLGRLLHLHPPTDAKKRARLKGDIETEPLPYLKRNQAIVEQSDVLVACPATMKEELRSGTWATVRYAREIGRPITFVWPSGKITTEGLKNGRQ